MKEKRFNELYNRAFDKGFPCYTDFLDLNSQSILESTYLPCVKFGGYQNAERVIAGFGENIENEDFPVSIIEIAPVSAKFAENLTHRDFLGGLMSLGIKRDLLGDIIVKDNTGYLFCLDRIKDYIIQNLSHLKHTAVSVKEIPSLPDGAVNEGEMTNITVASLRIDAVISAAYKLSRSESAKLFSLKKVFVNSRCINNGSYSVKENDIVSVRGFGRIKYISTLRTTKKERLVISVMRF